MKAASTADLRSGDRLLGTMVFSLPCLFEDTHNKEDDAQSQAGPGEDIAVLRVERHLPGGSDPLCQVCPGHKSGLGQDPAVRVDDTADAGGRGAEQEPPVLDGPEDRHGEVLAGRRRPSIPAVVGDGNEEISPFFREPPDEIGKDDLVADG